MRFNSLRTFFCSGNKCMNNLFLAEWLSVCVADSMEAGIATPLFFRQRIRMLFSNRLQIHFNPYALRVVCRRFSSSGFAFLCLPCDKMHRESCRESSFSCKLLISSFRSMWLSFVLSFLTSR